MMPFRESFLTREQVVPALWLSFTIHILGMLPLASDLDFFDNSPWFLGLILSNIVLIATALIPVVAVSRRQLDWFDPIAILSVAYLGMTGTFLLALLIDPNYVAFRLSFNGRLPQFLYEPSHLLQMTLAAQLILSTFLLIVLFINRHPIDLHHLVPQSSERNAAAITFLGWTAVGLIAWLTLWGNRSYLESITVAIGSDSVKIYESGEARFAMLSIVGLVSFSLGIVGGKGFVDWDTGYLRTIPLIIIVIVAILADLPSGSRIGVISSVVLLLYMARLFDYRIRTSVWITGVFVGLLVTIVITVIRGNTLIAGTPAGIWQQLVTNRASDLYVTGLESPASILFAADRVSAVAIVFDRLASGESALYGRTLLAGGVGWLTALLERLGMSGIGATMSFPWANEQILIWLFGAVVRGGTLPPSIPGELYMQGGLFGFLLLSALFGLIFQRLRMLLAQSSSLLTRWAIGLFLFRLSILTPTELSPIYGVVVYALPVFITYSIIQFFLRQNSHDISWQEQSQL